MKSINIYIKEALKLGKKRYKYQPETKEELQDLLKQLIKERGNKADLNDIDTSAITDMSGLFYYYSFNGDISNWDVSNVTDMRWMFKYSKFNGDISNWNVSNVTAMSGMFENSKFTGKNGDISNWNVSNVKYMKNIFNGCPLQNNPPSWYH